LEKERRKKKRRIRIAVVADGVSPKGKAKISEERREALRRLYYIFFPSYGRERRRNVP